MEDLSVFKTFYSAEEAISLVTLLQENDVKAEIGTLRTILDKNIIGDISQNEVYVKLYGRDFNKANAILDQYINSNLSNIEPDYYLNDFNDEELKNIIDNAVEWSNQDVIIAKRILTLRGHVHNEEELKNKTNQRIYQLASPESENSIRLFCGYTLSFIFPFYGVFYALMLYNAKKTIPNGQEVYIYNKQIRNHAIIMMIISVLIMGLFFIRVFTNAFIPQNMSPVF